MPFVILRTLKPISWSHLRVTSTLILRGAPASSIELGNRSSFTHEQNDRAVRFAAPFLKAFSLTYRVASSVSSSFYRICPSGTLVSHNLSSKNRLFISESSCDFCSDGGQWFAMQVQRVAGNPAAKYEKGVGRVNTNLLLAEKQPNQLQTLPAEHLGHSSRILRDQNQCLSQRNLERLMAGVVGGVSAAPDVDGWWEWGSLTCCSVVDGPAEREVVLEGLWVF